MTSVKHLFLVLLSIPKQLIKSTTNTLQKANPQKTNQPSSLIVQTLSPYCYFDFKYFKTFLSPLNKIIIKMPSITALTALNGVSVVNIIDILSADAMPGI